MLNKANAKSSSFMALFNWAGSLFVETEAQSTSVSFAAVARATTGPIPESSVHKRRVTIAIVRTDLAIEPPLEQIQQVLNQELSEAKISIEVVVKEVKVDAAGKLTEGNFAGTDYIFSFYSPTGGNVDSGYVARRKQQILNLVGDSNKVGNLFMMYGDNPKTMQTIPGRDKDLHIAYHVTDCEPVVTNSFNLTYKLTHETFVQWKSIFLNAIGYVALESHKQIEDHGITTSTSNSFT